MYTGASPGLIHTLQPATEREPRHCKPRRSWGSKGDSLARSVTLRTLRGTKALCDLDMSRRELVMRYPVPSIPGLQAKEPSRYPVSQFSPKHSWHGTFRDTLTVANKPALKGLKPAGTCQTQPFPSQRMQSHISTILVFLRRVSDFVLPTVA